MPQFLVCEAAFALSDIARHRNRRALHLIDQRIARRLRKRVRQQHNVRRNVDGLVPDK
jgi:hypothetical protein